MTADQIHRDDLMFNEGNSNTNIWIDHGTTTILFNISLNTVLHKKCLIGVLKKFQISKVVNVQLFKTYLNFQLNSVYNK